MPKSTYLLRIEEADEEMWRKFHSLCVLRGITIKECIFNLIREFVKESSSKKE